jgi:hypothetical protein
VREKRDVVKYVVGAVMGKPLIEGAERRLTGWLVLAGFRKVNYRNQNRELP